MDWLARWLNCGSVRLEHHLHQAQASGSRAHSCVLCSSSSFKLGPRLYCSCRTRRQESIAPISGEADDPCRIALRKIVRCAPVAAMPGENTRQGEPGLAQRTGSGSADAAMPRGMRSPPGTLSCGVARSERAERRVLHGTLKRANVL